MLPAASLAVACTVKLTPTATVEGTTDNAKWSSGPSTSKLLLALLWPPLINVIWSPG